MRKHLLNLFKIMVTVLGLAYVLAQIDLYEMAQTLLRANLPWIFISFLIMIASLVVRAYRWLLLLRSLGVSTKLSRLIELYFVSSFFNAFLPSGFGGDVVRVLEITREVRGSVAAGTVILDRLTGLVMLFVMALLVLPFLPPVPVQLVWIVVMGALVGGLGGLLLLEGSLIRRFGRWLLGSLSPVRDTPVARLLHAVQGCGPRAIAGALLVSFVFNLMLTGWWLAAAMALNQPVHFAYYLFAMPLLAVPLLVPSISGLGPRELLAPTLFTVVGMSAEAAVSLSLLVFVITRFSSVLGAAWYLIAIIRDSRARPDKAETATPIQ